MKQLSVPNGQTTIEMLMLDQSWPATFQNNSVLIVISGSLKKKWSFFLLFKELNSSNQSTLLVASIVFLSRSKFLYLVSLHEKLLSFWLLKIFDFWINNGLLNIASVLRSIWSVCSLVSAEKKSFFFIFFLLNYKFCFLRFYMLIYGFLELILPDFLKSFLTFMHWSTFHVFFLVLSPYHFIERSLIRLLTS